MIRIRYKYKTVFEYYRQVFRKLSDKYKKDF